MTMDGIPTIDIAPFLNGSAADKRAVADKVAAACRDIGFLVIAGHGIGRDTLERTFERSFAFYDLDAETKTRWHPTGAARQRGYHGVATRSLASTLGNKTPQDLRESVFLGPIDDHSAHFAALPDAATAYAPNLIPDQPDGVAEAFTGIYRAYERLSLDLLRIFAVALDLPEEHFTPLMGRHFSILGVHHYPALAAPPEPGQLRAGAHTDFGAMTILAMTEGRGGLEAQTPDGRWLPVLPQPGELVVNLGDMMQRWTNDRWVSTLHRVVVPEIGDTGSRRLSIGYFVHPDFDADIRCIPTCLRPGEAPKHPPITAGQHIRAKIDRSHKAA
ncbi:oxidoreductase, 2OG-Fe(II) oxygenase family protein [alpha proteobacterium BAL199]|jgi:isopenicillin N synthase-like dioxygenase|nr:oxidoreductase, 2OG-Fe(II) oxygenase family protein [alpha proteobacterium BAL199]